MARLYHPELTPPDNECEVPDDEGLLGVLAASGWLPAPEPEQRPGYEPEPVTYAPVEAKKTPAKKSAAKSDEGDG